MFAFLMGGAGVQDTLLLCRMESALHRVCCCKHASTSAALSASKNTPTHDALSRRPCCDEVAWESAAIPPSSASTALLFVAPSLLEQRMPVSTFVALDVDVGVARLADEVREATGPPIPIRHRALLI